TLRRLKAAGIPTVSVFLSGRPMWVNPELNQSDAFVAAWLPGTEGAGIADVLIGDRDGKARHDFRGTLSFSWPKDAAGAPLNRGQPGYDPQFAYGYGLTYARGASVPMLSEESGVTGETSVVDRYFVDGKFVSPWALLLNDAGGQAKPTLGQGGVSPRGAVEAVVVDDRAQESARQFRYNGSGHGDAQIWGSAVDLTRQANGELALSFRYRVDARPAGPVSLKLQGGAVDMTSLFNSAPLGEWTSVKIRLSCFRDAGAQLAGVETPFQLGTSSAFTVSVSEVRLASNENDTVCPAAQ
ncbi:MAG: 1,4-beta-D-glucan glucohydrolase, partial [Brevundimonas sp.]